MKKLTVIFCFILITVFSTGSYLIYSGYLRSYKREFKSYIFQNKDQTPFSTILINPSELYTNSRNIIWEDENKEVLYKGVLYDIIRIENRGLHVALIAVSDKQELSLKKQFAELFDSDSQNTIKKPFQLLKNFFTLKCVVIPTDFVFVISTLHNNAISSDPSFLLSSVFLSLETPPPDFIG